MSGVQDRYRGTFCSDCSWDASFQPPEVAICTACGGELVNRFTSDSYEYFRGLVAATAGGRFDAIPLPPPHVAITLASIAVHADEYTREGGHPFDAVALRAGLLAPGVSEYLEELKKLGLTPVMR